MFAALARITRRYREARQPAELDAIINDVGSWLSRIDAVPPESRERRRTWDELRECLNLWRLSCEQRAAEFQAKN